jgi:hypothetical protein
LWGTEETLNQLLLVPRVLTHMMWSCLAAICCCICMARSGGVLHVRLRRWSMQSALAMLHATSAQAHMKYATCSCYAHAAADGRQTDSTHMCDTPVTTRHLCLLTTPAPAQVQIGCMRQLCSSALQQQTSRCVCVARASKGTNTKDRVTLGCMLTLLPPPRKKGAEKEGRLLSVPRTC